MLPSGPQLDSNNLAHGKTANRELMPLQNPKKKEKRERNPSACSRMTPCAPPLETSSGAKR